MLQMYLFPCIKKLFVKIYQYFKYFYSFATNNFTSYQNTGNKKKVKKVQETKILLLEELNKIDSCFYQVVLFVA